MKKLVPAEELRTNLQALEKHLMTSLALFASQDFYYQYAIYPFLQSVLKPSLKESQS